MDNIKTVEQAMFCFLSIRDSDSPVFCVLLTQRVRVKLEENIYYESIYSRDRKGPIDALALTCGRHH